MPGRGKIRERPATGDLLQAIRPLFWDTDLQPEHLTEYVGWVLSRVLQFGDLEQVRAARAYFGDEAIASAANRRGVDARTRAFWRAVLEEPCTPGS